MRRLFRDIINIIILSAVVVLAITGFSMLLKSVTEPEVQSYKIQCYDGIEYLIRRSHITVHIDRKTLKPVRCATHTKNSDQDNAKIIEAKYGSYKKELNTI